MQEVYIIYIILISLYLDHLKRNSDIFKSVTKKYQE